MVVMATKEAATDLSEKEETKAAGTVPGDALDTEGVSPRRKRGAGEGWKQRREDPDDDEEAAEGVGFGEFAKADEATLAKRRIVKARRPVGGGASGVGAGQESPTKPTANPFSGVSLLAVVVPASAPTPSSTVAADEPSSQSAASGNTTVAAAAASGTSKPSTGVFGSAFPSISAPSVLSSAQPSSTGTFGTGFGAYKQNPFQAATEGKEGSVSNPFTSNGPSAFLSSFVAGALGGGASAKMAEGAEEEDALPEDLEAEPNVTFNVPKVEGLKDSSYKPMTGEEDETCIFQVRAKLYRLTEVKNGVGVTKEGGPGLSKANGDVASPPQVRKDWVESGVGQAKVLVAKEVEGEVPPPARVVMRREPGTSVLLNARLREPLEVAKHADKALRITCFEAGKPGAYLLRFKQNDEAEDMLKMMQDMLLASKDFTA